MNESRLIQVFASRLSLEVAGVLDAGERREAAAMNDDGRRARYERTRSFVRRTLTVCLGCEPLAIAPGRTSAGKPFVASEPRCEFSLSHSGDWLALAVAPFAVGVDIETRAPRVAPRALAERFFHPEDAAAIERAGSTAEREFLAQWVAKEAALKAAGTGIAGHLETLRCDFAKGAVTAVDGSCGRFAIHSFRLSDGTPGAVAWLASTPHPTAIRVRVTEDRS